MYYLSIMDTLDQWAAKFQGWVAGQSNWIFVAFFFVGLVIFFAIFKSLNKNQ